MTRRLILTDTAIADVEDIADFVAAQSGFRATGDAQADSIFDRCQRLSDLPGTLGTPRPELAAGLRSVPHKPYVIFFHYVGETIEIINVLHGSRDVAAHFSHDSPADD